MSEKKEYCLKEAKVRLCVNESASLMSRKPVNSASAAADLLADELRSMDREAVCVLNLDTGLRPINYSLVTIGSLNESLVPMESVFKSAILSNAANIMLMHNHPAGSTEISAADLEATKQVAEAGRLLNIRLVDHIIVAGMSGEKKSIRSEYGSLFAESSRVFAREEEMDKEAFCMYMMEELPKILPEKYRSQKFIIETVHKPSESYTGMICCFQNGTPAPVINLDELYEQYKNNLLLGIPAEELLDTAAMPFRVMHLRMPGPDLQDFEEVRKCLFIRMMDYKSNRKLLKDSPHLKIGTMAMTYYCFCGEQYGSFTSVRITRFMLEEWYHITPEELHEAAMENSRHLFPAEIGVLADESFNDPKESFRMVFITNSKKLNGASAIFYPGVMERLSFIFHGDYCVIPSSIHEMIAVRASGSDFRALRSLLGKGNKEAVDPEEKLSDEIYYYDAGKNEFRMLTEEDYTRNYS